MKHNVTTIKLLLGEQMGAEYKEVRLRSSSKETRSLS